MTRKQFEEDRKLCLKLYRKHWSIMLDWRKGEKERVYRAVQKEYMVELLERNIPDSCHTCFLCDFRQKYPGNCGPSCLIQWPDSPRICSSENWHDTKRMSELPATPLEELVFKGEE